MYQSLQFLYKKSLIISDLNIFTCAWNFLQERIIGVDFETWCLRVGSALGQPWKELSSDSWRQPSKWVGGHILLLYPGFGLLNYLFSSACSWRDRCQAL